MLNETKTPIKKLPFAVTKKILVEMYINQISEEEIRYETNIMLKKYDFKKTRKTVPNIVFKDFIRKYGMPRGYEI